MGPPPPLRPLGSHARLRRQLRRPPDPLDPQRRDQARPRPARRRDGFPVRHRVRRLLRAVRDSARQARRRLDAPDADRGVARVLERGHGDLGSGAQFSAARGGAHRRRNRRSRRDAGRLLAALRLLPGRPPRDRARALFERHLHRLRTRPHDRRSDRRPLGCGVRERDGPVRAARLAGGVLRRRAAGTAARALGAHAARAGARRDGRAARRARTASVPRLRPRARRGDAARDAPESLALGSRRARTRGRTSSPQRCSPPAPPR